jgi:hypothetical protein
MEPIRLGGRLEYSHHEARLIIDNVDISSSRVEAWVETHWQGNEGNRRLHFGTYNLMGARTVNSIVRDSTAALDVRFDWQTFVSEAIYDAQDRLRKGEAFAPLRKVVNGDRTRWLLSDLVSGVGATSIFGAGGSLKSLLAMAIGISVAANSSSPLNRQPRKHGTVGYLDWEADAATHKERLEAICRGSHLDMPEALHYRREAMPLRRSAPAIARWCDETDCVLLIVDSVMLARGGDAFGPEETLAMYAALREINRPALLVDHVKKEAKGRGGQGAYGSVVNENSARLQWELKRTDLPDGEAGLRLVFHKGNNVRRLGDQTWVVRIEDEDDAMHCTTFTASSFEDGEATTSEQIIGILARQGPMTAGQLADELEKQPNAVRARLSKMHQRGDVFKSGDRWTLESADDLF